MDQPYSVVADWLSKFHTWPMVIQGLWVIAIAVTLLGMTWLMMRGIRDITAIRHRQGDASLYGQSRDWDGPLLTYRDGRLRAAEDEADQPAPVLLDKRHPVIPGPRSGARNP
jgi:hypothetical protein